MLRYDGGRICRSSDHKFLKTILTDARFVTLLIGDKVKYLLGKKCLTAPACAMWLTRNVAAVVVLAAERAVFRFPCRLFHISHHFFCKGFFFRHSVDVFNKKKELAWSSLAICQICVTNL